MNPTLPLTSAALLLGSLAFTSCGEIYLDQPHRETVTRTYTSGHVVRTLPRGYRTTTISGTPYYHHDGTYYRPRGRSYVVVDRPHSGPYGDRDHDNIPNRYDRRYDGHSGSHIVRTLPSGYRVHTHRGNRYYSSGNTYYRSHRDGYIRVASPY